jgi:hypothetical protein
MRQLTPEEREALFADLRSFFEQDTDEETFSEDDALDDDNSDLGHGWSGDMPTSR